MEMELKKKKHMEGARHRARHIGDVLEMFLFSCLLPHRSVFSWVIPIFSLNVNNNKDSPNMGRLPPGDDSAKFTSAVSSQQHIFKKESASCSLRQ